MLCEYFGIAALITMIISMYYLFKNKLDLAINIHIFSLITAGISVFLFEKELLILLIPNSILVIIHKIQEFRKNGD